MATILSKIIVSETNPHQDHRHHGGINRKLKIIEIGYILSHFLETDLAVINNTFN